MQGQDFFCVIFYSIPLQSKMKTYEQKSPVGAKNMQSARRGHIAEPIKSREEILCHAHAAAALGSKNKDKKNNAQKGENPKRGVFAFAKVFVPVQIEILVQEKKKQCAHAQYFMEDFAPKMIAHEQKKANKH